MTALKKWKSQQAEMCKARTVINFDCTPKLMTVVGVEATTALKLQIGPEFRWVLKQSPFLASLLKIPIVAVPTDNLMIMTTLKPVQSCSLIIIIITNSITLRCP